MTLVLMEEQKLSIMQRNKINYILRSGQPLPTPKRKPIADRVPSLDVMRAKNGKRRTLDAIKASGGYDRAKYNFFSLSTFDSFSNTYFQFFINSILNFRTENAVPN